MSTQGALVVSERGKLVDPEIDRWLLEMQAELGIVRISDWTPADERLEPLGKDRKLLFMTTPQASMEFAYVINSCHMRRLVGEVGMYVDAQCPAFIRGKIQPKFLKGCIWQNGDIRGLANWIASIP